MFLNVFNFYLCFFGTATVIALDFSAEIISSVLHADGIKKMERITQGHSALLRCCLFFSSAGINDAKVAFN